MGVSGVIPIAVLKRESNVEKTTIIVFRLLLLDTYFNRFKNENFVNILSFIY